MPVLNELTCASRKCEECNASERFSSTDIHFQPYVYNKLIFYIALYSVNILNLYILFSMPNFSSLHFLLLFLLLALYAATKFLPALSLVP